MRGADAAELPRRRIRKILVIAFRFAVGGLAFFAEVTAAGFGAVQGIAREQFASLSAIAKRVTGQHWSGPRFFGLVGRAAK